uniref:Uncharacterized protein n=1 Tax=Klebsiella pneumoniae TaxID=573 RepID=A0A2P1BNH5_KLEPN|nr:hypothetical protein [Klebsiella pneumoniae]
MARKARNNETAAIPLSADFPIQDGGRQPDGVGLLDPLPQIRFKWPQFGGAWFGLVSRYRRIAEVAAHGIARDPNVRAMCRMEWPCRARTLISTVCSVNIDGLEKAAKLASGSVLLRWGGSVLHCC